MKRIVPIILALFLVFPLCAQDSLEMDGFVFSNLYGREGDNPDITTLRLRLWIRAGAWIGHLDLDAKKHGNELNQISLARKTKLGTFRIGRVFASDVVNTIPPHLLKTATYPRGENLAGPFFLWGLQWERSFGKIALAADYANGVGGEYDSVFSSANPVAILSARYTFREGAYVVAAGRYGQISQRMLVDTGYSRGSIRVNGFGYLTDEPSVQGRRVVGQILTEWQANSVFAPHIAYDLPRNGNEIYIAGVGIGDLHFLYLVVDGEFRGGGPELAVRGQLRVNF